MTAGAYAGRYFSRLGAFFTCDIAARPAVTFRFLESGEKAEDIAAATERAEAAAVARLSQRGCAYKNLRSQATDMTEAPLSKRQRHAITKTH